MTSTDLAFVIDDIAGYGVRLAGQYADWTLENVEWWEGFDGSGFFATGQSLYTPDTLTGSRYYAVATASNPEGTETVTLTSLQVSGSERTSFGTIFRDLHTVEVDGEFQEVTVSFGTHSLTGDAFNSEFRDGAPNNIYVSEANGIFTEYQYNTLTGEQGYVLAEDRADVVDWLYRFTRFENGEISSVDEERDDGVFVQDSYQMGEIQYTVVQDVNNVHDYEEIVTFYEQGEIISTSTIYDDGVGSTSDYQDGVLFFKQTSDDLDARDFSTIVEFFEFGVIFRSDTLMDDGREITREYSEGKLFTSHTVDTADAFSFAEVFGQFDGMGGRFLATLYDDGRVLERTFVPQPDGTGSRIDSWRLTDEGNAHSWSFQERVYDENNVLALNFRVNDNGIETVTEYDAGVRSLVTVTDVADVADVRNYTSITREYNDGVLAAQLTQLDDGRENQAVYDSAGQLLVLSSVDTADAFVWAEQTRTYEENGDYVFSRTLDNGIEQVSAYVDNVRIELVQTDAQDVRAWHSITDQFEDGVRVSREIVWDTDLIA